MNKFSEGFNYLERAKGRAFLDMLAGRSVRKKRTVDTRLIQKEQALQERLDRTVRKLRRTLGGKRAAFYKEYKRLQKERAAALEAIKQQSLEYAATTSVSVAPVQPIRGRLGDHSAILSTFLDDRGTILWLLSRKGMIATSVQKNQAEVRQMVHAFRRAVQDRDQHDIEMWGRELSGVLIEPVRSHMEGIRHLIIVPSKALHYLPYACLPTGGGRLLIQDFTLSCLPNASSLLYLDKDVTSDRDSLLAMGNPERERAWADLAFAEKEVKAISRNFQ
jgi:CHAT domain-containing protein